MAREISLRPAIEELDRITTALAEVRNKAKGLEREELDLKIRSLELVKEELMIVCGKTFPVYPLPRLKR